MRRGAEQKPENPKTHWRNGSAHGDGAYLRSASRRLEWLPQQRRQREERQGTAATFGVAGEEEARSVGRPVAAREGDSGIRRREPPVQGDVGREEAVRCPKPMRSGGAWLNIKGGLI